MHRTFGFLSVFVLCAVAGFAAAAPSEAAAHFSLISATICERTGTSTYAISGGRVFSNDSYFTLFCPFPGDGDLPHGSATGITVNGYDANNVNFFSATSCVTFRSSLGSTCSTGQANGPGSAIPGPTSVTLTVANGSLGAWNSNPNDFPWVSAGAYANQQIWGYSVTDL